ncbi:MAG: DUF2752 domain-containing protein [Planctomycetes bacterium]|nr:DUF2752 domain-containing protein [Planctomycetota bacterium]
MTFFVEEKPDQSETSAERQGQTVTWLRLVRMAFVGLLLVSLGNAAGLWDFHAAVLRLPNLCLFRRVTGHECPGCGITRSLALLSQGDLRAAFHQHLFGPPFLIGMALWAFLPNRFLASVRASRLARSRLLPACLAVSVLAWWMFAKA